MHFLCFQTVTDISLFPVIYFGSEYSHLFYYISPIILKFFAVSGEEKMQCLLSNYFYLGTMNWMAPEVLERPYPFQQFWKYCSTFTCWPTLMWNQFGKSLLNHDYYIVFHQRFFAVLVIFIVWRVSVWFDYL